MSNVGQAVVSLVGLAVGTAFFMPGLGLSLGNMLGQALFPTKLPTVEGPQIADQSITTSAIGAAWPWVFGKDAISGNVLWTAPLVNHRHTETAGGKGGPSQKSVYYTATRSYAVGLCRGPIAGITRIWRLDKLVYDIRPQQQDETDDAYAERVAASEGFAEGFTLYLGTADQMPDPTIEAVKGVGNTPAYRGRAYIVFTDEDQTDTSGRIPNWRFEVVTAADDASTTVVEYAAAELHPWAVGADPRSCLNDHEYRFYGVSNDQIGSYGWHDDIADAIADGVTAGLDGNRFDYSLGWSPDSVELYTAFPLNLPGEKEVLYLHYNRHVPDEEGGDDTYLPDIAAVGIAGCSGLAAIGIPAGRRVWWSGFYENGSPAFLGQAGIHRVASVAGAESQEDSLNNCTNYAGSPQLLLIPDAIIAIRRKPRMPAPPCEPRCDEAYPLLPETPNYCGIDGRVEHVVGYSVAVGSFKALSNLRVSGGAVTDYPLGPVIVSGGDDDNEESWEAAYAQAQADDKTIRPGLVYGVDYPVVPTVAYTRSYERHALQAIPPTVGSIVRDICEEVDVPPGRIEVSDLTDTVPGYSLSTLMTARQGIQPLQAYQFFDCVESDALLKFPKRGKPIVYTLTAEELGACFAGETAPPLVSTQIQQAVELPKFVRVHYKMGAKDYQAGMQQSPPRMTTDSVNAKDVQIAINMDDTKARQIAQVIHQDDWWGRETYEASASPALLALECADAIGIPVEGQVERARIVGVNMAPPFSPLKWTLRRDDDGAYVSYSVGAAAPPSGDALGIAGPSEFLIIDGPALNENANDSGVYVAAWGQFSRWSGAQILLSTDGGGSYKEMAAIVAPATVGRAVGVAGAGPLQNVWDYETKLLVDQDSGTLSSVTQLDVYNGSNALFYGADGRWELIQAMDAVLIGTFNGKPRYELSSLLRGRRGTEWAQGLHEDGDRVVLVGSGLARIPYKTQNTYPTLQWKAVTLGTSAQAVAARNHAMQSKSMTPYAPVDIQAERLANNDILFTWKRRARLGVEWIDGADIPLNEDAEFYRFTRFVREFELWDQATEHSWLYTRDQQQAEYLGTLPTEITVRVQQGSYYVSYERTPYAQATLSVPVATDADGSPPDLPSNTYVFTFEGLFDDRDDFTISTSAYSNPSEVIEITVTGAGKASFDDYADDLAAQILAAAPGATVNVDGPEVTVVFLDYRRLRGGNNTVSAINTSTGQVASGIRSAINQKTYIDLWKPGLTELSPVNDPAFRTPGFGSIGAMVYWRDYATRKAMGGNPVPLILSWTEAGTSDWYGSVVGNVVDAVNANSDFASRDVAASFSASPPTAARSCVILEASGDYLILPYGSAASASGFVPSLRQLEAGQTASVAGDPQISLVRFVLAGPIVEDQEFTVTLDGVDYTYTATSGDEGTDLAPIYAGLVAEIGGSADFSAAYEAVFLSLEITHNDPDTPFTCAARASYGGRMAIQEQ